MIKGKYNILGLKLTACDIEYLLDKIKSNLEHNQNTLIASLPVNQIMISYFNKEFKNILNKFDYLVADSPWVKNSLNFLYNLNLQEKIRGTDLTLRICELAEKQRYRIFLYGSTKATLKLLKDNLSKKYSKLLISGVLSPPFGDLESSDKSKLLERLETLKIDILFIALGTPKQEIFAYDLLYKYPSYKKPIVIIPVGAVFDFISGNKKQAPKIIQNIGFEWLFRLLQEPGRLWKRYLIYGPIFIFLIFIQKVRILLSRRS